MVVETFSRWLSSVMEQTRIYIYVCCLCGEETASLVVGFPCLKSTAGMEGFPNVINANVFITKGSLQVEGHRLWFY